MTQQLAPAATQQIGTALPTNPGAFIADPGALGTAAFALTTFVLSIFNAGLLPVTLEPVVFGLALFYGGVVQLVAGTLEFFKGSTFGAVVFCSYGGFWMSFWYYVTFVAPGLPKETAHSATGVFLLAWTVFTAYLLIAATRVHRAMFITFALLFVTFVLLTVGALGGLVVATRIGGFIGLATAAAAWYLSAASVLSFTFGREVLPLGKR
ncbi:acetate uptake transporter [Granulicoccus sp. GXG6511]|uniref:acetate uptake transporter n=1 Tax=Granulicoccus sp. GXG6511 TaxID=3381351 RepID=UPI003D7E4777